ncbi:MAG: glycosyltransferase [Thermoguttaceae bacterium]
MKIVLFINTGNYIRGAGGMEKVCSELANALSSREHSVTIVCNDPESQSPFFPLDSSVELVNINETGHRWKAPHLLRVAREITHQLRKIPIINQLPNVAEQWKVKQVHAKFCEMLDKIKPDVVIPFNFLDVAYFTKQNETPPFPIIVMQHFQPEQGLLELHQRHTAANLLKKIACIQLLLPSYAERVRKFFPVKTTVIPNFVPPIADTDIVDLTIVKPIYRICSIGRLDKNQKRPHLLISAFSLLAKEFPNWQVDLFGDVYTKNYKKRLEKQICNNKLDERVFLCGQTSRPMEVLKNSDIFAFPSRFEGFPLALTEAMSVGLPCVGFRSCPAVNELIVDGENGFLADDTAADFAAKLKLLMQNIESRSKMGKAGHEMMKQYTPEIIWDQWEKLIIETIQNWMFVEHS